EFAGDAKEALLVRLGRLVELMGDLGLPGSVVEMADDAAQKNLWEVRKAGLNIMMSLKGDGKPVSFIEDCAVPLEHLAEYTDALTEVFARHGTRGTWYAHASVGTLHVRPILDMRRDGAGTMCPSFRATRDEEHVTRGRANTLRLALSGQLGPDAFTGEAVKEALELCVSCKGCKRECPTGVDMARMKIEFLAHYIKRHGHSLKDRLVASLPDYAHKVSRVAWLANLRNWTPGAALLGERLLGLTAKRKLPTWRGDTFWRARDRSDFADAASTIAAARDGAKAAVLFVDTFNGVLE